MRRINGFFITIFALAVVMGCNEDHQTFEVDRIATGTGELDITFLGHGTLMFSVDDNILHIDPVARYADYTQLPQANLILITHSHGDHLDSNTVRLLENPDTRIVCPQTVADILGRGTVMENGDTLTLAGMEVVAVPAYNLKHKRPDGQFYHPKGEGNGYILTVGNQRIYIAGDTENIPEMADLGRVDIAFLPMNLPYTMTPEMVVDAVKMVKPAVLYPYHYGDTNVDDLLKLMKVEAPGIEVRVRQLQ
ncbi:MAG: MBL fold metallo-hydrolase [Lentisphaeria bacterium]|nr:MBL fold metallo-hydrolase [Candidatus Neomarinimicrobiota bacterium]MCF7842328.1 MBL fold metallo-hydrolase [Lentisphaeria bacterium]